MGKRRKDRRRVREREKINESGNCFVGKNLRLARAFIVPFVRVRETAVRKEQMCGREKERVAMT